jgi:hypothetical protein
MADNNYIINFFDDKKDRIVVQPNGYNDKATSLKLYGYGYKGYGEGLLENIVHLLENFCSDITAPLNPTIGQLWYRQGKKELL